MSCVVKLLSVMLTLTKSVHMASAATNVSLWGHKPEAQAKGTSFFRLRFRLVSPNVVQYPAARFLRFLARTRRLVGRAILQDGCRRVVTRGDPRLRRETAAEDQCRQGENGEPFPQSDCQRHRRDVRAAGK